MKTKKSVTLFSVAPIALLGIGTVGIIGVAVAAVLLAVVVGVVAPIALERKKRKAPAKPAPAPLAKKKAQPTPAPTPAVKTQPTPAPAPEKKPAPAVEAKPAPAPAPVVHKTVPQSLAPRKEATEAVAAPNVAASGNARPMRYNKSFTAKLIQGDEQTKRYYSEIKNHLLSYRRVRSKISWKWESFHKGRETLVKLRLRGKSLSVCMALNADDYADTKYRVEKVDDVKSLVATPCLYRIKNDRRLRYAKELIDAMMQKHGAEKAAVEAVDYARQYPFETTEALLTKKLIKIIAGKAQPATPPIAPMQSVAAHDVDALMKDEVASTLIIKSDAKSDRTKTGIVNIDTLSQCFKSGETVTLAEIKKRIKGFNKNITYIKVLARGTLDKPLTVEADGFSLQAVKMIALTGGTAIKKR